MSKATAVAGVSKLNPEALVVKSLHIETMLAASPLVFNVPKPAIVQLSTARSALITAIDNALNGGTVLTRAKHQAANVVRTLLSYEVDYVNNVAQGDPKIIDLSGFQPQKPRTPFGMLMAPDGLVLELNGKSGQLAARWNARRGAKSYNVLFTTGNPNDPNAVWVTAGNTTKARFILNGLKAGTFYACAVTALGAAGESAMSEAAISIAA